MVIPRTLISLMFLLLLTLSCIAQQVEVRSVPIKHVSPGSGEKMYLAYCAACHGSDGKGTGPAAPAMKVPPTDLTTLAKANGGKYPAAHVFNVIYGDTALPQSHGSKDMPVWGNLFSTLSSGTPTARGEVQVRINQISDHIKSLQAK